VALEAYCDTREEGLQLVGLLAACRWSSLARINVTRPMGEDWWKRFARATGGGLGSVGRIVTCRRAIIGARMEDLRIIWEATEDRWLVGWQDVLKRDGELGWMRLQLMLEEELEE